MQARSVESYFSIVNWFGPGKYMAPRSWLILFAGVQNEMVGNAEISVQLILKSNSESFGHWSKNLVYRPFNFPFQIVDHFYAIFICLNWNKSKFST